MTRPPAPLELRWSPDRLYWAVLEAPGRQPPGPIPPGLLALLADEIPEPSHAVHAVGVAVPAQPGRVAVCVARKVDLADLPSTAARLVPSALPDFIDGSVDADALNLLVGEFEPPSARRARTRRHALSATAVTLCAALATLGLFRREQAWSSDAAQARAARAALLAQTEHTDEDALRAALVRDRDRAAAEAHQRPLSDASRALAQLLDAWPLDVPNEPQSLAVGQDQAALSVILGGDPAPFLRALKPIEGWSAQEPRINSGGGVVRLTMTLLRDQAVRGGRDNP